MHVNALCSAHSGFWENLSMYNLMTDNYGCVYSRAD